MSLMISFSEILRAKDTRRRHRAEDCQIVYKDQLVDDRDTGHLLRPQLPDHNII